MLAFVSGIVTMGFVVAGLFFLRFWHRTGDALFAAFAAAFFLLAANQALGQLIDLGREELSWVWLVRVAAFSLIIIAIVRKNVKAKR